MLDVRTATDGNRGITEKYKNGSPIFKSDEVERAEMIANALKGLTIKSAQQLLAKVNEYLLQTPLE